ncbi:YcxB family protein [Roseateles sp. BYS78W]|uniref:YcxB family protein n=1 Tax=Pelomonas candidula TaxID=3299025 RepID=UPI003748572D
MIVLLALMALVAMAGSLWRGHASWAEVFGPLAIAYFPAWYWLYLPWKVRRLYAQQRSLHQPFSVEIETAGLQFRTENGSGLLPWGNLYRWRESGKVFVLYQSDLLFSLIPKRCFESGAAQDEFRTTLARQVGPVDKPRARP